MLPRLAKSYAAQARRRYAPLHQKAPSAPGSRHSRSRGRGRAGARGGGGSAAPRGYPRREARVPGVGRAVEGGADGPGPKTAKLAADDGCGSTCRSGCPAASACRTARSGAGAGDARRGTDCNKPRRQDRRRPTAWKARGAAPQAGSRVDFPDDDSMRTPPRGDLPGRCSRPGPRRAQAGARRRACARAGRSATRRARSRSEPRGHRHRRRNRDQRAARRGRRTGPCPATGRAI